MFPFPFTLIKICYKEVLVKMISILLQNMYYNDDDNKPERGKKWNHWNFFKQLLGKLLRKDLY